MKQIDEVILTYRDKLIKIMELPNNIRKLSEEEIICETGKIRKNPVIK